MMVVVVVMGVGGGGGVACNLSFKTLSFIVAWGTQGTGLAQAPCKPLGPHSFALEAYA